MFGNDFDVMLYVRDVGRSIDFYRGVLGFDFKGWWSESEQGYVQDWAAAGHPGYAELAAGPLRVSLHSSDDEVASGGCMLHLRVTDVDAFHARVEEAGGDASEPTDEPWGWRMSTVTDPDGHPWGFYTPIEAS